MVIEKLRVNHIENPLGYGLENPCFSWVVSESTGSCQAAARLEVAVDQEFTDILFDSKKQENISSLAYYPKLKLQPYTRYYWRVSVWADDGDFGVSKVSWFETGKMNEAWTGRWITTPYESSIHPLFYRRFRVDGEVASARAYICGLGIFELEVNGKQAGDECLTPFYNDYNNWIQYITYDITDLLKNGDNAVGAALGNGWFKGRFGFGEKTENIYGSHFYLLCEIRITYKNGNTEIIGSDDKWMCHPSPVKDSSIYDGETYDAGMEVEKWSQADCSMEGYQPACYIEAPAGRLMERLSPAVRKRKIIKPVALIRTPAGEQVLDFGQNLTGWFTFWCNLPRGREVRLSCGEILQKGNFYNENLRTAREEYHYISNGKPALVRPHFTFYGFRYLKVEGIEKVNRDDFTAYAIYSDLEETGSIETSNEKINQLFRNAFWGQRGNFLDVPTDCPQRDERMGWTGDAQIFSATASFNMYTPAFYKKFLYDMKHEQKALDGAVPYVVPDIIGQIDRINHVKDSTPYGSCAWADSATVIPWVVYLFYGDKGLLSEQYENMKLWVDYIKKQDDTKCNGSRLWTCGFHYADWLALDNPDKNSCFGGTDSYYVASAYYFYSSSLLAKAAEVLGLKEDAKTYGKLSDEVKEAISNFYFESNGNIKIHTQTALVLALHFGFVPDKGRKAAVMELRKLLEDNKLYLKTGFVGTPYLCPVLSDTGRNDYAYTLLLHEDYPSWLYEVNLGATTVWERWNSVMPDGSISGTGMNSLNHYAYGSIAEWMYRYMCGLNPSEDKPGFKQVLIKPMPDSRFHWVKMKYQSASGEYAVSWACEEKQIRYTVKVPFDAKADFMLASPASKVTVNGWRSDELEQGFKIQLTSGTYEIISSL